MSEPVSLRARAEGLAGSLPPLMVAAEKLAANVFPGSHGRRRAGMGSEFWQFRPAHAGDEARHIDWRQSARSDSQFVREREWQAAQSLFLWVDDSLSMQFASSPNLPSKHQRAALLAMAVAVLLVRGGERVGLAGADQRAGQGEAQLARMALRLSEPRGARDYGLPDLTGLQPHARAVMLSDFLGDAADVEHCLQHAADAGVSGALVQVLDPQEESFPFHGRTIFESMGRSLRHETLKASDLRSRYLARLRERKARLADIARKAGWQFHCTHTDSPPQATLLWLYSALEQRRT